MLGGAGVACDVQEGSSGHLMGVASKCGHHIARMSADVQHLLKVPQQASPRTCANSGLLPVRICIHAL